MPASDQASTSLPAFGSSNHRLRAIVVIPTYNERENIEPLLEALLGLPLTNLSVLVVDDASPAGTGDVVRRHAVSDPRVTLLSRPRKEGLGGAYTAAFNLLLGTESGHKERERERPEALVQMDADFSHDPGDVPRLLAGLFQADLVVGSRYVQGGHTKNWGLERTLLSRSANRAARLITHVPLRDLTGGFNAWRTSLLASIRPDTIRAEGYGYLVELKVRAARAHARVLETPITFTERRLGASKLSKRVIWEAMGVVFRLRARR